jgi:flagellar biosynthesis/type III secretory pathway protein FliH
LSLELRVEFALAPARLSVAGGAPSSVEFENAEARARSASAAESRARTERFAQLRAERARRRAAREAARHRFEAALERLETEAESLAARLDAELTAAAPRLVELARRVAETVLKRSLEADPLLLLPAIERAISRVRADLDAAKSVELRVRSEEVARFEAALAGRPRSRGVTVVADDSLEGCDWQVRCDVRRIRYALATELERLGTSLDEAEDRGAETGDV